MGEFALFLLYKIEENFGKVEQLRKGLSRYQAQGWFLLKSKAPSVAGRGKLIFISFQNIPYFGTFT